MSPIKRYSARLSIFQRLHRRITSDVALKRKVPPPALKQQTNQVSTFDVLNPIAIPYDSGTGNIVIRYAGVSTSILPAVILGVHSSGALVVLLQIALNSIGSLVLGGFAVRGLPPGPGTITLTNPTGGLRNVIVHTCDLSALAASYVGDVEAGNAQTTNWAEVDGMAEAETGNSLIHHVVAFKHTDACPMSSAFDAQCTIQAEVENAEISARFSYEPSPGGDGAGDYVWNAKAGTPSVLNNAACFELIGAAY